MAASKYDFSIEQGSSYRFSLKYKDDQGNIIPLTDYCARISWKTNIGESVTLYSTDSANSNYKFYIDEPNGTITLLLSANYTNSFDFTSAKYDLELKSPNDLYTEGGKYTIRLLYGTINIVKRFSQTTEVMGCST
jgi:hypothetical protein